MTRDDIRQAIFGSCDGAASAIGFVGASIIAGSTAGLKVGAIGLAVDSAWSMGSSEWLGDRSQSFHRALVMAFATLVGCLVPAIPFLIGGRGLPEIIIAVVLVSLLGVAIAEARPGDRIASYAETFGVLLVSAALAIAVGVLA